MRNGMCAKLCAVIGAFLFVTAAFCFAEWKLFLEPTQWHSFGKGTFYFAIIIAAVGGILLACGLVLFLVTRKQSKQAPSKKEIRKTLPSAQSPRSDKTTAKSQEIATSSRKTPELFPCKKCGSMPTVKEGWDTLQIVCSCGNAGEQIFGDYYDEAFMLSIYGDEAVREWNRRNA